MIFKDDQDRKSFLGRMANVIEHTQTQCYAFALIPNHFHALLRTGPTPLSKVMRRLMTGYAVCFNKRHKRSGHLFQNRYKSVVCEEEAYLLELIRYVHLNPLRAGLVKTLKELDDYPWTGHSVILGRKNPLVPERPSRPNKTKKRNEPDEPEKTLAEKTVEDVLLHFGDTVKVARRRYREFVEKGIAQGCRPDLQGGGLVRSAGGETAGLLGRKSDDREKGDPRILGSGDFVESTLHQSETLLGKKYKPKKTLEELILVAADKAGISPELVCSRSRQKRHSQARAIFSYLAVEETGHSAADVARCLGVTRMSVHEAVSRGKTLCAESAR